MTPCVTLLDAGPSQIRTAVLFPTDHVPGSRRLPVVLSPYGGPHHAEVLAAAGAYGEDQWLADQGFCVVVADGRGTPGRGPAWDRAVLHDLAGPVLDDQVTALEAVAATWPDDVDTTRVGIRGWSFGGYLAALAVLRRPDVFHAAVAGAPVTEWRLYDTAYTERYLGDPTQDPTPYDACSLLPLAHSLTRPLLIIHGLTDDNVVVGAHAAAVGRPHGRGPPAPGAAAVRRHAHDAAGGGRGEQAAPRARLPPWRPRRVRRRRPAPEGDRSSRGAV